MNEVYILEKQNRNDGWDIQGVYSNYKSAQKDFIYKDGCFRIIEQQVRD